ncbi:WYL domain-containing protein [Clostridium sp. JS66]|uniref:WYL domain-containing protein n=1 Tax=Clostridium sp. JS66 TaxID=3064705 RepID=UPI00298E8926|nr:WYL domain-containing protein [Clostridium sp. JS66]WPC39378.1 WYL domain-containing protein [Clostridium sp. JS66]
MELFSEIYSCYYKVIEKILNTASKEPVTQEIITSIINNNGFSESALYILPKLIHGDWQLLDEKNGKYISKLNGEVKRPLTLLEKSWLKAILSDKRIVLFLKQQEILHLRQYLKDVEPLFDVNDFYYYDMFLDGDNYGDENYIRNFRMLLEALKDKRVITICFENRKRGFIIGSYIPLKIQYSSKNDKFRVYTVRIRYNKIVTRAIINIARISSIESSNEKFTGDIEELYKYINQSKCTEPVVIEISKERNALERCMLHFASYEKRTEYDEETDKYISYIYYDKQDEKELLIRILSFGPVIKVLGPEVFLNLVKDRVKSQLELLEM